MKERLTHLFEFNRQANKRFIDSISKMEIPDEKVQCLFGHVLIAHKIWLHRILKREHNLEFWGDVDPTTYTDLDLDNLEETITLIKRRSLADLVTYTNSQGKTFENRIDDILFHIINHSTYHRGQVAIKIKEDSIIPPVTDYIHFRREQII